MISPCHVQITVEYHYSWKHYLKLSAHVVHCFATIFLKFCQRSIKAWISPGFIHTRELLFGIQCSRKTCCIHHIRALTIKQCFKRLFQAHEDHAKSRSTIRNKQLTKKCCGLRQPWCTEWRGLFDIFRRTWLTAKYGRPTSRFSMSYNAVHDANVSFCIIMVYS